MLHARVQQASHAVWLSLRPSEMFYIRRAMAAEAVYIL